MKLKTLGVVAWVGIVGCAGPAAKSPPGQALVGLSAGKTALQSPRQAVQTTDGVETPGLHVSPEIARLCGIAEVKAVPHFGFDSTALAVEDRDVLAAVAKCMSDGALRGKNVALVGRTDARGESEYNFGLGEARADSVRRYLHDLGVSPERLASTSRGELDAKGSDEATWAEDRRVDIELASFSPAVPDRTLANVGQTIGTHHQEQSAPARMRLLASPSSLADLGRWDSMAPAVGR